MLDTRMHHTDADTVSRMNIIAVRGHPKSNRNCNGGSQGGLYSKTVHRRHRERELRFFNFPAKKTEATLTNIPSPHTSIESKRFDRLSFTPVFMGAERCE